MEYVLVELGLKAVTADGITEKLGDHTQPNEKKKTKARFISFEMKTAPEDAIAFLYNGNMFMMISKDDNCYEAMQVEVTKQ